MILITNQLVNVLTAQTNTDLYAALIHPTIFPIPIPSQKIKFACISQCPLELKLKKRETDASESGTVRGTNTTYKISSRNCIWNRPPGVYSKYRNRRYGNQAQNANTSGENGCHSWRPEQEVGKFYRRYSYQFVCVLIKIWACSAEKGHVRCKRRDTCVVSQMYILWEREREREKTTAKALKYREYLLRYPWARQLSQGVLTDLGFLGDKSVVVRDMIKGTRCTILTRHTYIYIDVCVRACARAFMCVCVCVCKFDKL